MQFRTLIICASLLASSSLAAGQTITQTELDQTLSQAQVAMEAGKYDQAFELYNQAAHWGHKGAQYVLGELYLRGEGTQQNEVVGLAWLEVAAESRDREYVRALKNAKKSLSDSEIEKADALADQISDAYGLEAAQVSCKRETRVGTNIRVTNCYHTRVSGDTIIVPEEQGDFLAQL